MIQAIADTVSGGAILAGAAAGGFLGYLVGRTRAELGRAWHDGRGAMKRRGDYRNN